MFEEKSILAQAQYTIFVIFQRNFKQIRLVSTELDHLSSFKY